MEKQNISEIEVAKFLCYLKESEKSKLTIEKYERDIYKFLLFQQKKEKLSKETVIAYKESLMEEYAAASVNSMLAAINTFFVFLEMEHLKVKPLRMQKKIFVSEKRQMSKNEYKRLIKACEEKNQERLSLIIQTICSTGIRISELSQFTVRAVKCGKIEVYSKGKMRIVFIPEKLRIKLIHYIRKKNIQKGCIFVTKNKNPVNRSNVWADMKKICKYAGVLADKVFPHNLRHLFARTYYNLEKDITKLADLLGHSNIDTTRIYIMATEKEHRRQIAGLNLLM